MVPCGDGAGVIWPCFTEVAHRWPLSLLSLSTLSSLSPLSPLCPSAASAIISVVFLKETLRASDLLGKITNSALVLPARLGLLLTLAHISLKGHIVT